MHRGSGVVVHNEQWRHLQLTNYAAFIKNGNEDDNDFIVTEMKLG